MKSKEEVEEELSKREETYTELNESLIGEMSSRKAIEVNDRLVNLSFSIAWLKWFLKD